MKQIKTALLAMLAVCLLCAMPAAGVQKDIPLISTQTTGVGVIPVDRTMPLVVDEGGYLTAENYQKLNTYAEQIAANYPYEVAVAFVQDLNGMDVMDYADDFYDYNGYGAGDGHDGILLLVCPESRDYWMTAGGQGMQMFDDDRMAAADDSVVPYLANSDWAGAADEFLWICERQLSQGMPEPPSRSVSPIWILIDAVLGFLGGAIPVSAMKSQLKSVAAKREASHWVDEDGLVLTASRDRVKGTHYLRRQIPQQRSGGSGGGGHSSHAHVSSSGQTHTGRGGKF